MTEFLISSRAYTKLILHAAKYPHGAVNGILLADKNSVKSNPINIVDAIPLFHQCLYVTPMIEIALIQVEAMADANGLVIAGYYGASENFYDASIEKAPVLKLADKIVENFQNACFIVIDNKFVCLAMDNIAVKVFRQIDNKWSKGSFLLEQPGETLDAVSSLLQRGAMNYIADFDNHLDYPENDWTNQSLNNDLSKIMALY